jgi:hypothetical protein
LPFRCNLQRYTAGAVPFSPLPLGGQSWLGMGAGIVNLLNVNDATQQHFQQQQQHPPPPPGPPPGMPGYVLGGAPPLPSGPPPRSARISSGGGGGGGGGGGAPPLPPMPHPHALASKVGGGCTSQIQLDP